MYDYLVEESGLYEANFAHSVQKSGKTCLVIDERPHLGGCGRRTVVDYFTDIKYLNYQTEQIAFTGMIDAFFGCRNSKPHIENEILDTHNLQGNTVIIYTDGDIPYTHFIELKPLALIWQNITYTKWRQMLGR